MDQASRIAFARMLSDFRKSRGLTQEDLALRAGVSSGTISRAEQPSKELSWKKRTFLDVAKALNRVRMLGYADICSYLDLAGLPQDLQSSIDNDYTRHRTSVAINLQRAYDFVDQLAQYLPAPTIERYLMNLAIAHGVPLIEPDPAGRQYAVAPKEQPSVIVTPPRESPRERETFSVHHPPRQTTIGGIPAVEQIIRDVEKAPEQPLREIPGGQLPRARRADHRSS